jgi:hypothetical protein
MRPAGHDDAAHQSETERGQRSRGASHRTNCIDVVAVRPLNAGQTGTAVRSNWQVWHIRSTPKVCCGSNSMGLNPRGR